MFQEEVFTNIYLNELIGAGEDSCHCRGRDLRRCFRHYVM